MKTSLKNTLQYLLFGIRNVLVLLGFLQEVSILCYHSISDAKSNTSITPDVFKKQIKSLKQSGVRFVSVQEIVEWMNDDVHLPHRVVALTFDDGYADFETNVLPILEIFKIPATVFVVGNNNSYNERLKNKTSLLSNEAIARLRTNSLIEIGYHSMTHANLTQVMKSELIPEITNTFGYRFFAYPGGAHSQKIGAALRRAKYKAAFTIGWNTINKNGSIMHIPRSVILKNMPLWRVQFATTIALHWYKKLTNLFK